MNSELASYILPILLDCASGISPSVAFLDKSEVLIDKHWLFINQKQDFIRTAKNKPLRICVAACQNARVFRKNTRAKLQVNFSDYARVREFGRRG
jgi:hypothetical protein